VVHTCKNRRWDKDVVCGRQDVCKYYLSPCPILSNHRSIDESISVLTYYIGVEKGKTAFWGSSHEHNPDCKNEFICRDFHNPQTSGRDWRTETYGWHKPTRTVWPKFTNRMASEPKPTGEEAA
jgi:hypothetical protein